MACTACHSFRFLCINDWTFQEALPLPHTIWSPRSPARFEMLTSVHSPRNWAYLQNTMPSSYSRDACKFALLLSVQGAASSVL